MVKYEVLTNTNLFDKATQNVYKEIYFARRTHGVQTQILTDNQIPKITEFDTAVPSVPRASCQLLWISQRIIFTNSAPLGRVGHRVAMSVCMSVCVSVPSRNTPFRRSCRPLVEDRVHNIGLG